MSAALPSPRDTRTPSRVRRVALERRGARARPTPLVARWPPVLALALALLLLLGWPLLAHPLWTAPSRDPAWYTWRANVILEGDPGRLAAPWGPPGVFAGGYRITTPLAGALLERVAGVDPFTFTALLFVAVPVLTGLFLGAAAYRSGGRAVVVPVTMLASVAIFLTPPFIGYLDGAMSIMFLSLAVAFAVRARASWPSRAGAFLASLVAALTHPTTCALFVVSLLGAAGSHLVTSRFDVRGVVRRDGPAIASVGAGLLTGVAMWAGIWGPAASLGSAAVAPPYATDLFLERLDVWIASLQLPILAPLIVVAIVATALRSRRTRRPAATYDVIALWWLLPLAGTLAFLVTADRGAGGASSLPYHRFLNGTGAPIAAAGLGAAAAIAWALRLRGRLRAPGAVVAVAVVVALGWMIRDGLRSEGGERWATAQVRVALAGVHELAAAAGERPIVLVMDHGRGNPSSASNRAYGWAKAATNAFRIGLPGDVTARSATYVGTVENLVAGVPTTGDSAAYDAVARRFFLDVQARRRATGAAPLALVWTEFYPGSLVGAPVTPVTPTLFVVEAGDLFRPSAEALAHARTAAAAERRSIANHPGAFGVPGHLLVLLVALVALLVVPGALAAPFFRLDDDPSRVGLVPGISIVLTLLSGVLVLAAWRGALTGPKALLVVALACASGFLLRILPRARAVALRSGGWVRRRLVE